jgi:hypothetical protein
MNANYPQIAAAVYQACTTYDQYLPQLSPDLARSWAKVFARFGLTAEQLIKGVDAVYATKGNGYRPLPADIAEAARSIRQSEAMAESDAQREARQEALSAKAVEDAAALAERKGIPPAEKYHRPAPGEHGPARVRCPWCHAGPGQPCVVPRTNKRLTQTRHHPSRIEAAEANA